MEQQQHTVSVDRRPLGPPERPLCRHHQGHEVDESAVSVSLGVKSPALDISPRPKLNTETDSELEEVYKLTLSEGQPRTTPVTGPLDLPHGE